MNKNGVIAVVVVVISIVLVGLWAMRSGEQSFVGADCSAPPSPPVGVAGSAEGSIGRVTWTAPPQGETVSNYIIEAGTSPGANNAGTFVSPANRTTFEREAAANTYYVRMFARNACGTSPPSQEITVTIK